MILRLPALVIALVIHEFAHGYAAYKLGDLTAKHDGRLTLNPLKHLDPIGTLMIIFIGFGWAKPVMVNPYNLRNPKQDMAIISMAGPLSNFILAFFMMLLNVFLQIMFIRHGVVGGAYDFIITFLTVLVFINIMLGIFNLIPIPPLDGSKLFSIILPDHLYFSYINFRWGMLLMVILIFSGGFELILFPIITVITTSYFNIALWIFSFLT